MVVALADMATVGAETAMTAHARYRWFKTRHHSFSGSGETKMQERHLSQCELSLHTQKRHQRMDQGYLENAIEETRQIGNKRAMGSQRDRQISTRKGLFITIHAKLPRMRAEGKRGLFRTDGINSSDV
ncbi:hypothetical protein BO85DRAFT_472556 [Aspergillus piperis CBS 112811]|uniref:Uncharacterized protein n=1 Tax=Aspergillus piperis CBS 112811 TaxID=1448313 RepID=A0A8G1VHT4_9EURO|nr:hypothetical protein BO85DRAFT_472556 [Aspergillus piperis CBS 112811]RAH52552.1 hypothetical protein BO85DRAFT_472556 [Aspergillus piperis CBS 112811]